LATVCSLTLKTAIAPLSLDRTMSQIWDQKSPLGLLSIWLVQHVAEDQSDHRQIVYIPKNIYEAGYLQSFQV
jgi:hypothetical protein